MKELCAAVVLKAVQDWKEESRRDELRSFFNSKWGDFYCSTLNLSAKDILAKLEANEVNTKILEEVA